MFSRTETITALNTMQEQATQHLKGIGVDGWEQSVFTS